MSKASSPLRSIPIEKMMNWLRRRSDSGRWFICFDNFLEVMNMEEAWTVQRIINLGGRKPKNKRSQKRWEQGWILCTIKYLLKTIKASAKKQNRILDSLIAKGFIQVRKFGIPGHRHIFIDHIAIETAIDSALNPEKDQKGQYTLSHLGECELGDSGECAIPRVGECIEKEKKNKKRRDRKPSVAASPLGVKPPSGFVFGEGKAIGSPIAKEFALSLHTILSKKSRIVRKPNFGKWVKAIDRLRKTVGDVEIKSRLDWYCRNIGKPFVPEILCGESFLEKWPKLVAAMERQAYEFAKQEDHYDGP